MPLVALVSIFADIGWQRERNQRKSGFAVLGIFKAHNVLTALRPGLQFKAILASVAVIPSIDLHVLAVAVVGAGQPFRSLRRRAHRRMSLAGNHVPIPSQSLLV